MRPAAAREPGTYYQWKMFDSSLRRAALISLPLPSITIERVKMQTTLKKACAAYSRADRINQVHSDYTPETCKPGQAAATLICAHTSSAARWRASSAFSLSCSLVISLISFFSSYSHVSMYWVCAECY